MLYAIQNIQKIDGRRRRGAAPSSPIFFIRSFFVLVEAARIRDIWRQQCFLSRIAVSCRRVVCLCKFCSFSYNIGFTFYFVLFMFLYLCNNNKHSPRHQHERYYCCRVCGQICNLSAANSRGRTHNHVDGRHRWSKAINHQSQATHTNLYLYL